MAVEAALITPLVVVMIVGLLEMSLLLRDAVSLNGRSEEHTSELQSH